MRSPRALHGSTIAVSSLRWITALSVSVFEPKLSTFGSSQLYNCHNLSGPLNTLQFWWKAQERSFQSEEMKRTALSYLTKNECISYPKCFTLFCGCPVKGSGAQEADVKGFWGWWWWEGLAVFCRRKLKFYESPGRTLTNQSWLLVEERHYTHRKIQSAEWGRRGERASETDSERGREREAALWKMHPRHIWRHSEGGGGGKEKTLISARTTTKAPIRELWSWTNMTKSSFPTFKLLPALINLEDV